MKRQPPETLSEARKADRIAAASRELRDVVERLQMLQDEQRRIVKSLRRAGLSWGKIAPILGVSPQAARQRFDK